MYVEIFLGGSACFSGLLVSSDLLSGLLALAIAPPLPSGFLPNFDEGLPLDLPLGLPVGLPPASLLVTAGLSVGLPDSGLPELGLPDSGVTELSLSGPGLPDFDWLELSGLPEGLPEDSSRERERERNSDIYSRG